MDARVRLPLKIRETTQNKTLIGYPCAVTNRPHSRAASRRGSRGDGAVNDDRLARRNRLDSGRLAPGCGSLGIFA